jgi:hypothetical protein
LLISDHAVEGVEFLGNDKCELVSADTVANDSRAYLLNRKLLSSKRVVRTMSMQVLDVVLGDDC